MEKITNLIKNHIGYVIGMMLIMLITIISLFFSYRTEIIEGTVLEELNASQTLEISKLKGDVDTLTKDKEKLIEQVAQTVVKYDQEIEYLNETITYLNDFGYVLSDYDVAYLKEKGFERDSALLNTLKDQNHLIPIPGVLGGNMQWWPELSVILNNRMVFGYFEDGHILGHALLEYTFDEENNLIWRVIEVFLD